MSLGAAAGDFDIAMPLTRAATGNLYVDGSVAGVASTFMVDTGSGLTTVNATLFKAIKKRSTVEDAGRMAVRLANGRIVKVRKYRVADFRLGADCDLGPIEVAVLPNDGTNILGLDTLGRAAPFAFHFEPPQLAVSACLGTGARLATN
ncbi:MAG: retroviral-like aspartic protease family protein [Gammaproteobacteria bacterium]